APARLEWLVPPALARIVVNALVAALRAADEKVELLHLLFRRGEFRRRLREEIAPLRGTEVRGEVVQIAEQPGIGKPAVADVGRHVVEIAQTIDAEEAEHEHEQEKEKEHRGKAEANRSQLPHGGASPHRVASHYQLARGAHSSPRG